MHTNKNSSSSDKFFHKKLQLNNIFARILQKDPSVWSSDLNVQQSIKNRLGWVQPDQLIHQSKTKINEFYEKVQHSNHQDFVWIGMGGSSLFAKTLTQVFPTQHFHIIDNTDTVYIDTCLSKVDLSNTLFFVASKSGTTLETLSVFNYLKQLNIPDHHFVSISDPNTSLSELFASDKRNFYDQFINPDDIGGRFSSLSYFGLLPFALINHHAYHQNIDHFLEHFMDKGLHKQIESFTANIFQLYKNHTCNKLVLHFPDKLSYFTHWVEQLVAESTGKNNCGFIPFPSEYIDADRQDYIHISHSEHSSLTNHFSHRLPFPINAEETNLLLQSYIWMHVTAILGYFLELNPFDEPNVALSKSLTQDFLNQEELKPENTGSESHAALLDHLDHPTDQHNFIAILLFGHNNIEKLKVLCKTISKTYKKPCIPYYGPQYLHSVGQYFKGGHHDVSFVIAYSENINLSEEQIHLEKIKLAQSLGDYHALQQLKKPVFFIKCDELFKLFQII